MILQMFTPQFLYSRIVYLINNHAAQMTSLMFRVVKYLLSTCCPQWSTPTGLSQLVGNYQEVNHDSQFGIPYNPHKAEKV